MVVRISLGKFDADQVELVAQKLQEGYNSLFPAISSLPGLVHYYVGLDREKNYMTNVSVWVSVEAAHQMYTLNEMLVQRDLFVGLGVEFIPISNHEVLWEIKQT